MSWGSRPWRKWTGGGKPWPGFFSITRSLKSCRPKCWSCGRSCCDSVRPPETRVFLSSCISASVSSSPQFPSKSESFRFFPPPPPPNLKTSLKDGEGGFSSGLEERGVTWDEGGRSELRELLATSCELLYLLRCPPSRGQGWKVPAGEERGLVLRLNPLCSADCSFGGLQPSFIQQDARPWSCARSSPRLAPRPR